MSIALRNKEELLVGVVYEVCRDELYWTYKGAPSYLNNKEIHVSDVSDMDEAFVALGFPYVRKSISLWRSISCTSYMEMWEACACKELPRQNFAM